MNLNPEMIIRSFPDFRWISVGPGGHSSVGNPDLLPIGKIQVHAANVFLQEECAMARTLILVVEDKLDK